MTTSGGNSLLELLDYACKQTYDLSFWIGFSDVHLWHLFYFPCRYVMHWHQNILLDFQSCVYWHRLWIVNYAERQESDTRRTTHPRAILGGQPTHARYSQENTQPRAILGGQGKGEKYRVLRVSRVRVYLPTPLSLAKSRVYSQSIKRCWSTTTDGKRWKAAVLMSVPHQKWTSNRLLASGGEIHQYLEESFRRISGTCCVWCNRETLRKIEGYDYGLHQRETPGPVINRRYALLDDVDNWMGDNLISLLPEWGWVSVDLKLAQGLLPHQNLMPQCDMS